LLTRDVSRLAGRPQPLAEGADFGIATALHCLSQGFKLAFPLRSVKRGRAGGSAMPRRAGRPDGRTPPPMAASKAASNICRGTRLRMRPTSRPPSWAPDVRRPGRSWVAVNSPKVDHF
jgi:hypothetical protein